MNEYETRNMFRQVLDMFRNGPPRVILEVCSLKIIYHSIGFTTAIVPRTGEYVQLDGAGKQTFKVEAVFNQLGNNAVLLKCSIESDFDPASYSDWRVVTR